jgi:hypothetical protein
MIAITSGSHAVKRHRDDNRGHWLHTYFAAPAVRVSPARSSSGGAARRARDDRYERFVVAAGLALVLLTTCGGIWLLGALLRLATF